jgi:hypothetical protein
MSADPVIFSDADHAFLRHVRFGELPARVRLEDQVELVETEPKRGIPEPLADQELRRALLPGI